LSRRPCVLGDRGGEVKRHARLCRDAPRIDQTEAADPNVVLRTGRKGGQQVAALLVGDHNLGVPPRAQTGRFRDDPYAGLRSIGTGHHTADVGGPIRSCWAPTSLGHAAKNVATLTATTL